MLANLQAKWRDLHEKERQATFQLERQYGTWYAAPRGKREKVEKLKKRVDAASDKIFAWLDANSPRDWRHGAPAFWICDELTEADALTSGQLSVVPPVVYGQYESDAIAFARPIKPVEVAPCW